MDTVIVDGLRVAYERVGAGPPVVLAHGYVGDGRATWGPQLDALADGYTVVAWDAPGAGLSADPPENWGMAGYADCLAGFIDGLGLVNPHVVGLSSGGALAIELCRRHSGVASTVVLASAYAGWGGSLPAAVAQQRLVQALALSDLPPEQLVATILPTMFAESTPEDLVSAFGASLMEFHPVGLRAMARACAEDLRDALPRVNVPTLLIYGDKDIRAPRDVADHIHTAIPGSKLVVLPGAGHICNIDDAPEFNRAVRAFLGEHAGASSTGDCNARTD